MNPKVAALEATDLRHDRQIEAMQRFAAKATAKVSMPFDEDDCLTETAVR